MYWIAVVLLATFCGTQAQSTAEPNVAVHLRECYTDPTLLDRNNLPPATLEVLIDIIQKIEDNPDVNLDLRMLSTLLLHTYRQDGIVYHPQENPSAASIVLPYSPTFHAFYRHRLLISKLVPNNLQTLPNNTISSPLKCAIHNMLSTTIDARLRGDENMCGQLSQYRAMRIPRSAGYAEEMDDVEVFEPPKLNTEYGQMRQFDPIEDVEFTNFAEQMRIDQRLVGDSTCPILTGVVRTRWGAVSAGTLIAGIAAGAEMQQVTLTELTKGPVPSYANVQQNVLNLYPATLSGDLAEAVLIQGTSGIVSITVGNTGNWNSSQAPRYYMLSDRNVIEMTDPEIRGGIDGFVLGSRMTNILQTFSTLKLSQLLDMYNSPRNGVFDPKLRACNRQELGQSAITDQNFASQTESFTIALNSDMLLPGTIVNGLDQLVTGAVTNLQTYMQNNMHDLDCALSESLTDYRTKTNLYIVLDASWPYQTIYPAISYLLDVIEVGKYGSSVTILSAFDGSVVINQTFHLSDFHSEYTLAKHQSLFTGVNLETAYTNIRNMMQSSLQNETLRNYVGGNSTVLLFLLHSGNLQNNQMVAEEARKMNDTVPDLRVLFATSTNQFDSLWNLVRDMYNDIHVISLSTSGAHIESSMAPVLSSIQTVGRRIINPVCGFEFTGGSLGSRHFDDFVEPGYINFYTLRPNYFFRDNDNTKVTISRAGAGSGSLTICHSRVVVQPRRNGTITGVNDELVTCEELPSSGNVEIRLQNACGDYSNIYQCPPLYISVQSVATTASFSAVCTDSRMCRFPYNIRYTIQVDDLRCFSGTTSVGASLIFIISALMISLITL